MRKKPFHLAASAALLVTLSACGSNHTADTSASPAATAAATAAAVPQRQQQQPAPKQS